MGRSRRTWAGLAAAGVVLPLGLAACGGSTTTSTAPETSSTVGTVAPAANAGTTVKITKVGSGYAYEPGDVTVKVGETLTWTNDGGTKHTVSADKGQTVDFKSPTILVGETYVKTFDAPGTFGYYCSIHGADVMKGTITVTP